MGGAEYVIGGSSGVMHLACLCGPKVITWGDSRTYFGETLEKRYKETWNPLDAEVHFLFDDNWCPAPNEITKLIGGVMDKNQRIGIPQELWDQLVLASETGRYMVSTHYIDASGTIQHHWLTQNFPKEEMLPSLNVVSADVKEKVKLTEVKGHAAPSGKEIIDNSPKEEPKQLGVEGWK